MRRRYTNELPIEEYFPEAPMVWSFAVAKNVLTIEQTSMPQMDWGEYDDPDERKPLRVDREERAAATPIEARALLAAEVAKLCPRAAPPIGKDAALLVVEPVVRGEYRYIRADDEPACETGELATKESREVHAAAAGGDDRAVQVLADWLLTAQDPVARARGELINLHAQLLRGKAGQAAAKQARKLLVEHADAWTSGLLPHATIGFRLGFVETLELGGDSGEDRNNFQLVGTAGQPDLRAFVSLPIAARLRRVVLGGAGPVMISGNPYIDDTPLLRGLAGAAALKDLVIRDANLDTLTPIEALPALETLTVDGFVNDLKKIRSKSLRDLAFIGDHPVDFEELATAKLPKLRSLRIERPVLPADVTRLTKAFPGVRFSLQSSPP
jgi:hypothetical protein